MNHSPWSFLVRLSERLTTECGWVVDKFGVRWQVAPADFDKWNTSKNAAKRDAVMQAMWKMKKLDIKKLKVAFDNA